MMVPFGGAVTVVWVRNEQVFWDQKKQVNVLFYNFFVPLFVFCGF